MSPTAAYRHADDLPVLIPVFPLDGALLFPRAQLPLNIFEPRYLNMIDDAIASDRMIGMIQTTGEAGDPEKPLLAAIGCAGRITSFAETDDGRYLITLTGICRFEVAEEIDVALPYRKVTARYNAFESDLYEPDLDDFERDDLVEVLKRYADFKGYALDWDTVEKAPAEGLIHTLCTLAPFGGEEKQALLQAAGIEERRDLLIAMMEMDMADPGGDALKH